MTLSAAVAALAAGDFTSLHAVCTAAGLQVGMPAAGIIQIGVPEASAHSASAPSLLLSVGVHGDETAPIELLAGVLQSLSEQPLQLRVNLLVVVGNLAAIAQAKRYVEADLNRLFRHQQSALADTVEAPRASAIMAATSDFFARARGPRWHLDLHTAIRPSLYPTFAIIPDAIAANDKRALADLLGQAGIAAVVLNPTSAGTYSAFTAEYKKAISATVELGQVSALGDNDVGVFDAMAATLSGLLLQGKFPPAVPATMPIKFLVAQEIIKHSEAFHMHFDGATRNFTALDYGSVIATDGAIVYRVTHAEECVIFPNPNVRAGLRAGLMVVRAEW